jgi:hypothetical protein
MKYSSRDKKRDARTTYKGALQNEVRDVKSDRETGNYFAQKRIWKAGGQNENVDVVRRTSRCCGLMLHPRMYVMRLHSIQRLEVPCEGVLESSGGYQEEFVTMCVR